MREISTVFEIIAIYNLFLVWPYKGIEALLCRGNSARSIGTHITRCHSHTKLVMIVFSFLSLPSNLNSLIFTWYLTTADRIAVSAASMRAIRMADCLAMALPAAKCRPTSNCSCWLRHRAMLRAWIRRAHRPLSSSMTCSDSAGLPIVASSFNSHSATWRWEGTVWNGLVEEM